MIYNSHISNLRERLFKNIGQSNVNEAFFKTIFEYLKENDNLLDIGTGNGYVIKEIEKKIKFKINLFGNDSSASMLKKAELNNKTITFILCDNYHLSFKSNYFDIIVAKNVTRFSAKEIYRVLKPGGVFIYREYGKHKGLIEIAKIFRKRLIRSRYKSFYDNKMSKAGFSIVNSTYIKDKKDFKNVKALINTIKSYPMIKNFNLADEKLLKEKYKSQKDITINSDAFLAIYKKEN